MLKMYFQGGLTSEVKVSKEGSKYVYFMAERNHCKYRLIKATGEIQSAPYWNTVKGAKIVDESV